MPFLAIVFYIEHGLLLLLARQQELGVAQENMPAANRRRKVCTGGVHARGGFVGSSMLSGIPALGVEIPSSSALGSSAGCL